MKKLVLLFCVAFLIPQGGALAHQEAHVHSQWIKQKLAQQSMAIQELKKRIEQLGNTGSAGSTFQAPSQTPGQTTSPGSREFLNEVCSPNEQNLCQKGCPNGWKIEKAICGGKGSIGKTYHDGRLVSCYCFSQNDPNCKVERVTATCVRP